MVLLIFGGAAVIAGSYLVIERLVFSKLTADAKPGAAPAIQSATPPASAIPEKSIAVLPFVDMSEKKDQEYFSDGLSEELIDHLAHAEDLKVIARTSSFQFKGKSEDVRSIAVKLGVANVLEGSVRKAGKELRITAQLIRASDGSHIWSQTYERSLTDVFKIQDEIASHVAEALKAVLATSARSQYREPNTEAYNFFLKGIYFTQRGGRENAEKALPLFQEAIRLDSNYALAWVSVGDVYRFLGATAKYARAEAQRNALNAAQRALAIAPNLSDAHRLRGSIYRDYEWNWNAARSEYVRAVELDANNLWARDDMAYLNAVETANFADAISALRQDLARNPIDAGSFRALGGTYWAAGRLQESAATFEQLLALNPAYPTAHAWYANTLLFMGKNEQALAALEKESDEEHKLQFLPTVYWALGRRAEADAALLELRNHYEHSAPFEIAMAYAYRKDADAAFEWLDRAYQGHAGSMTEIKFNPYLRELRGDPRYKALLRNMNLPQ